MRDTTKRHGTEVLTELRRVIASGEVTPGTPIPLEEVAAFFHVSLIPGREALKLLLGEGLVAHEPRFGYSVTTLTSAELQEIYIVQGTLEVAALNAAVQHAGPADDIAVHQAHAHLATAVATDDKHGFQHASRHFHLAILTPCRMHRLLHIFVTSWNLTEPAQTMMRITPEDRAAMQANHQEMLDAFLARDADRLQDHARQHHTRLTACISRIDQA